MGDDQHEESAELIMRHVTHKSSRKRGRPVEPLSNYSLAKEFGVSESTMRRARHAERARRLRERVASMSDEELMSDDADDDGTAHGVGTPPPAPS